MNINSINGSSFGSGMIRPPQAQEITEAQTKQVASILADYDSSALTVEDTKSINAAFNEAGIKPCAGLRQAIQDAGFDAEAMRGSDHGSRPSRPRNGPPSTNSFNINTEVLAELQSILEKYTFDELTAVEENEILTELDNSGLLIPGLVVYTSV